MKKKNIKEGDCLLVLSRPVGDIYGRQYWLPARVHDVGDHEFHLLGERYCKMTWYHWEGRMRALKEGAFYGPGTANDHQKKVGMLLFSGTDKHRFKIKELLYHDPETSTASGRATDQREQHDAAVEWDEAYESARNATVLIKLGLRTCVRDPSLMREIERLLWHIENKIPSWHDLEKLT